MNFFELWERICEAASEYAPEKTGDMREDTRKLEVKLGWFIDKRVEVGADPMRDPETEKLINYYANWLTKQYRDGSNAAEYLKQRAKFLKENKARYAMAMRRKVA